MPSRRAPGEGTVFFSEAKQVWLWRAVVGHKPDGSVRYKSGRARTQAEGLKRKQAAERAGRPADPDRATLGEYLRRWLEEEVRPGVRPASYRSYEIAVRKHLVPAVGGIRLARVSAADVNRYLSQLARDGVSDSARRTRAAVLTAALAAAATSGLLQAGAVAGVAKPRYEPPPVEVFSDAEVAVLSAGVAGHRREGLVKFLLGTGARLGEALALDWADLAPDLATVHIRRTQTQYDGRIQVGPPKSARGNRIVDLPDFVRAALAAARPTPAAGPLFRRLSGPPAPASANRFRSQFWYPLLDRLGLPRRKPHALRHTHVSRLLAAGVSLAEVARRIGDSPNTVVRTYAHWMPGAGRALANLVNDIYGGGATFAPPPPGNGGEHGRTETRRKRSK